MFTRNRQIKLRKLINWKKATRVIGEPNAADLVDILPDSEINPELDSSIVVINLDEIEVFAVNDQTVDPVEKTLKFSEL